MQIGDVVELYLTPFTAIVLLVIAVSCGHLYRENWKLKPDNWQRRAWYYGVPACTALLALGFIPLKT